MECELPAGHTARALKKALPERSVVSKDARTTVNSAASMFALYLSSIAQENAAVSKRQTVVLKDVLQALRDADFEHFIMPVEECLRETKIAAALKKSRRGGAERAGGEDELDADNAGAAAANDDDDGDDDENMQSAEDAEEDDENDANGQDADDDDEKEEDVIETNVDAGEQNQRMQETAEDDEGGSAAALDADDDM